jgi:hypothetical protein
MGTDVVHFAVNVDPAGTQLDPVNAEKLQNAVGHKVSWIDDFSVLAARPAAVNVTEVASTGFFLVLGLLFVEAWLALRFGSTRRRGDVEA